MKIVVFCPNLIGDTVMATPAFRALRRGFAGATIVGVIKPHVAPVLDGLPYFDRLVGFDPKSRDPRARTPRVVRTLRAERPDLAVLFPNSFRSGLMACLSGARRRVGYARGGRGLLLTDRLTEPRDQHGKRVPNPIVEYYLELPRRLGCPTDSLRTELATTAADEAAADRAWDELGLRRDEPVVCLNTGGAFGPAKNWPVPHFASLARRLATENGLAVLVICGPGERANAQAIVAGAGHPRVVSLAGQPLSLGLSKACVRRSSLLITTDSGPRHFAAPFRVPVLSLFGPTFIAWTRMHDPLAVHLFQPVPCGPCQKPVCPFGHHRCMQDLSPEAVYRAAVRMLAHSTTRTGG
ncbi:MAG: lipopolysaccharide heptosyltransferase II [Isosphaeraceae bacterium]|nr:lipopolysaccharide heptosyltransferase II [Isosphaeraceae bacterium]